MGRRRWIALLAGVLAALLASVVVGLVGGTTENTSGPERSAGSRSGSSHSASALPRVEERDLPAEARRTLDLIDAGGPFPYDEDGRTFFNREGLLPEAPEGHYREYTVATPGEGDRGARRIVAGRDGDRYWTADHYASFERIAR